MKPTPYEMGFDYAVNGATTDNCNFALFSTPARSREWERGKEEGKKVKKDRRKGKRK
jgi:hypothetical protein